MCLLVFLLVVITLIIRTHQATFPFTQLANFCSNDTMFANNSAYQTNLNTLFHSLSSNATNNPSGFYRTTVGSPTSEVIYGHYLCRGDQNTTSCHKCVAIATTTDLPKTSCPNGKVAVIWYDECMVRYSNDSYFDSMEQSPAHIYWSTKQIIGNTTQFIETVGNMTHDIALRAAEGGPFKKFATGFNNYSILQPIYGVGQCTPDLAADDCYQCLNSSINMFRQTPGGRILAPSCVIRYEDYPFFNLSYLPQPLLPPPSPSPSPANDNNTITIPSSSSGIPIPV